MPPFLCTYCLKIARGSHRAGCVPGWQVKFSAADGSGRILGTLAAWGGRVVALLRRTGCRRVSADEIVKVRAGSARLPGAGSDAGEGM